MDDAPPERLDPAQRTREIVDLEVGKGDGVARTLPPGVHPDRRHAPTRLPALALSCNPVSHLHTEQATPEAKRPFGLVGGELHQSQPQALDVRNMTPRPLAAAGRYGSRSYLFAGPLQDEVGSSS